MGKYQNKKHLIKSFSVTAELSLQYWLAHSAVSSSNSNQASLLQY